MKKYITYVAAFVAVFAIVFLSVSNGSLKRKIRNMSDDADTAIYVDFIMSYGGAVSKIKNYIMWDEEIIPVVTELDSLGYDFARKTGAIEYNLYAIDRNGYWEDTYKRMMEE